MIVWDRSMVDNKYIYSTSLFFLNVQLLALIYCQLSPENVENVY